MYEKSFSLEIVTPLKVVFQGNVTSLSAPGALGGFQVLYDHAPFFSLLTTGILKVRDDAGQEIRFATRGGFVEVKGNKAVVLAETAERPEEIDVPRAREAMERARQRLHSGDPGVDLERARAALYRALNRLKVVEKA